MNIDQMTIGQIREIQSMFPRQEQPMHTAFKLGQKYLIRTVTFYYTGKLDAITPGELVLSNAAWISHTGRYNNALKTGQLTSVEPVVGDIIISRAAIVDAAIWSHDLPSGVK